MIALKRTGRKPKNRRSDFSEKRILIQLRFIDAGRVHNRLALQDFIEWLAHPRKIRKPKLHKDFAKLHGVDTDTLGNWKKLKGFWDEVKSFRGMTFRSYSTDVFYGLVKVAKQGNPRAVELFAKLFEGYREKLDVKEEPVPREIPPEQIELINHALTNIGLASIIKFNKQRPEAEEESDAEGQENESSLPS